MSQVVPVLVGEDTIYARSPYPDALLFWRTAAPVVAVPRFLLGTPSPPVWAFFDLPWVDPPRPLPKIAQAPGFASFTAPALILYKVSFRPPDPDPEYQTRINHQVLFQINRPYALQIQNSGFTLDIPDFCDDPWREWVHPPLSPEALLYPFRQITAPFRGQQFNLFFGQPLSPRLDPESDTLRLFDAGIMVWRQARARPKDFTTCGKLDVYDYGNGSVLVAWGPFTPSIPGTVPDSYNVYVNGVLNQNVPNAFYRLALITGLFGASYNGVVVTPATTYQLKVVAVSAGVEVSESDTLVTAQPTSVALITSMKRIYPFPSVGLN